MFLDWLKRCKSCSGSRAVSQSCGLQDSLHTKTHFRLFYRLPSNPTQPNFSQKKIFLCLLIANIKQNYDVSTITTYVGNFFVFFKKFFHTSNNCDLWLLNPIPIASRAKKKQKSKVSNFLQISKLSPSLMLLCFKHQIIIIHHICWHLLLFFDTY